MRTSNINKKIRRHRHIHKILADKYGVHGTPSTSSEHMTREGHQDGFILPFVLVTIAAISLIAISCYNAITKAGTYSRALQDRSLAARALMTAEAETTYTFLKSAAGDGEIIVPPRGLSIDILVAGLEISGDGDTPLPSWSALGGIHQSTTLGPQVLVSYRDASGFIPINKLPVEQLRKVYEFAGFATKDAAKLAAETSDFIDADNERQIQGAERANYRLFNKPPPANSPVRLAIELNGLLSIPSELGSHFWRNFSESIAPVSQATDINRDFILPALEPYFVEDTASFNPGLSARGLAGLNKRPGTRARFLLVIPGIRGESRAIEIEKTVRNLQKPFKRLLVSERVGTDGVYEPELAQLLQTLDSQNRASAAGLSTDATPNDENPGSENAPNSDTQTSETGILNDAIPPVFAPAPDGR